MALDPTFAGRTVEWSVGPNPPDFICFDSSGARIGVELSEWLDESQIASEKPRYDREREFLSAIDSAAISPLSKIGEVLIFARVDARLKQTDALPFRAELCDFLARLEESWLTIRGHDHPQGVGRHDYTGFPLLSKYLAGMTCTSQRWRPASRGTQWISFINHGGPYSPNTAVEALAQALRRKTRMYDTLCSEQRLDELYLLLYYDQARRYNTPFDTPEFGFEDIAKDLARLAREDHGVFKRIFLFESARSNLSRVY